MARLEGITFHGVEIDPDDFDDDALSNKKTDIKKKSDFDEVYKEDSLKYSKSTGDAARKKQAPGWVSKAGGKQVFSTTVYMREGKAMEQLPNITSDMSAVEGIYESFKTVGFNSWLSSKDLSKMTGRSIGTISAFFGVVTSPMFEEDRLVFVKKPGRSENKAIYLYRIAPRYRDNFADLLRGVRVLQRDYSKSKKAKNKKIESPKMLSKEKKEKEENKEVKDSSEHISVSVVKSEEHIDKTSDAYQPILRVEVDCKLFSIIQDSGRNKEFGVEQYLLAIENELNSRIHKIDLGDSGFAGVKASIRFHFGVFRKSIYQKRGEER